jgi:hypothetical protein
MTLKLRLLFLIGCDLFSADLSLVVYFYKYLGQTTLKLRLLFLIGCDLFFV